MDIIVPIVVFVCIIFATMFRLDFRVFVATALLHIISCAILFAQGNESRAEQIAIYAFYFMVVGLFVALVQSLRSVEKRNNQ